MIHKFYAVTGHKSGFSLYSITDATFNQVHKATAKNIARRSRDDQSSGQTFGAKMISIGKNIIAYNPHGGVLMQDREIENVPVRFWSSVSAPVMALFLDEHDAVQCFGEIVNPIRCSPDYLKNTLEVIGAIGLEHEQFHVAYGDEFALITRK